MSKPCGRLGCAVVMAMAPYRLKRRTYCSSSCAILARIQAGWTPGAHFTAECRARGARKGGHVSGAKRHRRTMEKAVQQCDRFLSAEFREGLSPQQLARIRVLMARAFLYGHVRGRQAVDTNRRYWRRKAERQKAAA